MIVHIVYALSAMHAAAGGGRLYRYACGLFVIFRASKDAAFHLVVVVFRRAVASTRSKAHTISGLIVEFCTRYVVRRHQPLPLTP